MCSENNRHKNGTEWRNFYGRFKGKSLSATQSKTLITEFEKYSLESIPWIYVPGYIFLDIFPWIYFLGYSYLDMFS